MIRMNSLERACGNTRKAADKDSRATSMTLQDGNNFNASAKVNKECSFARRKTDNRCPYFTLLTPDSNGNWRAVAVPFNCLSVREHDGSGSQSFTDGTWSESEVHHHRRNKVLTNRVSRKDVLPGKAVHRSSFNNNGFNVTNISDNSNSSSKVRISGKKNHFKTGKKKGKKDRKLTIDEASSSKNTDSGTSSNSWETASTVLSPDSCSNSSEDNSAGSNNYSKKPKNYTIDIDKGDTLETNCGDISEISETSDSFSLSSVSVCSNYDDVAISSSNSLDMRDKGSIKAPKKSSLKKFNDHSVDKNNTSWRKVSGNISDRWSSGMGKLNSFVCPGVGSSRIGSNPKKNYNVSQSVLLSKSTDENESKVRNLGNLKRRTSTRSKQELNSSSRKSFYASKSTSNLCTDVGTKLNNSVAIKPHLGRKNGLVGISQPLSKVNCMRMDSDAEKIESSTCGHFNLFESCSNKVESLEQTNSLSSSYLKDSTDSEECKIISPHLDNGNQIANDVSAIQHNKNDPNSGPSIHLSIPVSIKDSELARSDFSKSLLCVGKEVVSFKVESTAIEMNLPKVLDCSVNNESFETSIFNDPDKILQAVNDAYKAQLASDTVENSIGYPIAEIEKFLYAASPLISVSNNISRCCICVPDEASVAPICKHNMPNLSLKIMWEWYDKHGTFGLEVKADDYDNSKRLGFDRFTFCAYFVPFLSAVQLLRRRRSYSSVGVPLFSVLVPQPKKVDTITKKCDDFTSIDEYELVYEYFEVERPQHRRPLFEMIKNLVSGNEPLQGRAFGDPSSLVSMAINDLHPRSWYSVAWYPIYRIPDEKFQSAFLTYHSLGHLVHENASVVSPVVGLQNYNTQGECWLRPRNLPKEKSPNYNSCEILKERLRTLEHTASVMARAEVVKGNATSINNQPDYEFFLSRRRW